MENDSPTLNCNYLLVSGIPCVQDIQGRRWLDAAWAKDLALHLRYIPHLTLACPLRRAEPPPRSTCITANPDYHGLNVVGLPHVTSWFQALLRMPATVLKLWRAVGRADVVHSSLGNWPIPYAWITTPFARLRGRRIVAVVESAAWRCASHPSPLKIRLRAWLWERAARRCLRHADVGFYTQEQYRDELPMAGDAHVIHASWIDEDSVLDASAAEQKLQPGEPARLLHCGRLVAEKGTGVLLDAMRLLSDRGVAVSLDIMGDGPLLESCRQAELGLRGSARVHLLGTMDHDEQFFQAIRGYGALVVPNLSDEQPRVIYDAYSQAVPILGSDTPGLRTCVTHGVHGRLTQPGSAAALADLLAWAIANPADLRRMGLEGLTRARAHTHWNMHLQRWRVLHQALARV